MQWPRIVIRYLKKKKQEGIMLVMLGKLTSVTNNLQIPMTTHIKSFSLYTYIT